MNWKLVLTGPAQKGLRRIPKKDLHRIEKALSAMELDPFGGDIVRLKAQPTAWRRRVGEYRIFFDLYPEDGLIVVTEVIRRSSTTY